MDLGHKGAAKQKLVKPTRMIPTKKVFSSHIYGAECDTEAEHVTSLLNFESRRDDGRVFGK